MKKLLILLSPIALLFAMMITLTSCSSEESIVLNVYNWGEYISDGFEGSMDVNAEFEKYCSMKLGKKVTVNYSTYASNEDMYAKLSQFENGQYPYDIVIPSDYMIQKLIDNKMLEPFGAETIPNYKYINEDFKKPYYDENELYSVPYTYGMIGVIYNKEFVDREDYEKQSWDLLWNPKYKGKILQFNNPRDAFATAMYLESINVNSQKKEDWDKALEKLKEQKPLVQAYVNDEIFNKMETASAAIAPYYAGDFLTMENEDLDFYYPKEGVNYFVDAMCILKGSKNVDIAKEYINFMLDREAAVANALYIGYASPNNLVVNDEEYQSAMLSDYGERALEILYGTQPKLHNAEYNEKFGTTCYEDFTKDIQDHVNELWESLKTEHSTEIWIHITTAAIVVGVVSLAVYTTYIKKKRSRDYRMRDKAARLAKQQKKTG